MDIFYYISIGKRPIDSLALDQETCITVEKVLINKTAYQGT